MSLLGLDVGTTGCKAVVFDPEGNTLAQAYREYPEIYPRPGWVEMDAEVIWRATQEIIREVAANTKTDPIKALSLSVLGEAVTPIDKKGNVLHNSVTSVDSRCTEQCQWWETNWGKERIFAITGMPLHPSYTLNKLLWFKQERPDIYAKTWKFLLYEDLVIFRLGLQPTIDYSLASRTMSFDIKKHGWSDEILSAAGIERDLLAEAAPSGQIVGEIAPKIASELGLPKGTLVVSGGHDQPMCALGAGLIREGMATVSTGTVECAVCAFKEPLLNKQMLDHNHPVYCHVAPELYITLAFNYTAGALLRWFRDNFAQAELSEARSQGKDVYDLMLQDISPEPQNLFWLPHFIGSGTPYLDPDSKGALIGLNLATTKPQMVQAILESVTYELKTNLDSLESAGVRIEELRAMGGGSKSPLWLQMKADILGKQVTSLQIAEAGCLGAAILAGTAIGLYSSLEEAVSLLVKPDQMFHPDSIKMQAYQRAYQIYAQIYPVMRELNLNLSH